MESQTGITKLDVDSTSISDASNVTLEYNSRCKTPKLSIFVQVSWYDTIKSNWSYLLYEIEQAVEHVQIILLTISSRCIILGSSFA